MMSEEEKGGTLSFCLDEMLGGPLSLHENERSPLALTLEQKLVLLGETNRPDYEMNEKGYKIGIRGSVQEIIVKDNDPFFLELTLFPPGGGR